LKLQYDELLSNFAFKINLRRYSMVKMLQERVIEQEQEMLELRRVAAVAAGGYTRSR
jgi:hypothetical protein